MKNYFRKYSTYFIVLGIIIVCMLFTGLTPRRIAGLPEAGQWGSAAVFILVGIIGKFIPNEEEEDN